LYIENHVIQYENNVKNAVADGVAVVEESEVGFLVFLVCFSDFCIYEFEGEGGDFLLIMRFHLLF
jgi:hypothetical protein